MYGIFTNIFPKNQPNVGKYSIHGAYGIQVPRASYHWFSHFLFLSSSADFEASHTARMAGHCCLSIYYRLYYRYYIYIDICLFTYSYTYSFIHLFSEQLRQPGGWAPDD